ncbi:tripartite tricarboxylate transporter substrate binding protein [Curvibacter sp. HBC28]|uniref:Tripartite tricarboxylate transporter substrate binding protein n=1 Tax=Curvibacter microcysteis TaxID=3026419 RepID=A0ABT5MHD9_9BURK|nr:tripartite tricarboxylate transporter substrate binding protein [Curvibacter sp. HBC28]MDD0816005.1 tripartite tricarboxylate transporter substrate binding protein [Curvibacter sp. HBC28]
MHFTTPQRPRRALLALAAASGLSALVAPALAQDFPQRPVRIITPFPVGSGPEGVARLLADKLSRAWGKSVLVENRPGGNGFVAIDAFKRGANDGHDLIQLDNVHLTAYPHLMKKLPYDPVKDFEPVLPLFKAYFMVATAKTSPYRDFKDLLADAKARPGQLNYGSWSVGNPVHLGSARLAAATGVDMTHVIFKETTQLYTSVANGDLSFALGSSGSTGPLYRAGKIKYLAVAAPKRLAAFPDVPTLAEAGGPKDLEVSGWTTLALPPGLPRPLVERLRRDLQKVLAEPDMLEKFTAFGYEPFQMHGTFDQYISAESKTMAEVIRATRSSLD